MSESICITEPQHGRVRFLVPDRVQRGDTLTTISCQILHFDWLDEFDSLHMQPVEDAVEDAMTLFNSADDIAGVLEPFGHTVVASGKALRGNVVKTFTIRVHMIGEARRLLHGILLQGDTLGYRARDILAGNFGRMILHRMLDGSGINIRKYVMLNWKENHKKDTVL